MKTSSRAAGSKAAASAPGAQRRSSAASSTQKRCHARAAPARSQNHARAPCVSSGGRGREKSITRDSGPAHGRASTARARRPPSSARARTRRSCAQTAVCFRSTGRHKPARRDAFFASPREHRQYERERERERERECVRSFFSVRALFPSKTTGPDVFMARALRETKRKDDATPRSRALAPRACRHPSRGR